MKLKCCAEIAAVDTDANRRRPPIMT